MRIFLLILTTLFVFRAQAQSISGWVTDTRGLPLVGANVYLKKTYLGTTTNKQGYFMFEGNGTSNKVLVISFLGYCDFELEINGDTAIAIEAVLKEKANNLEAVQIQAGQFSAGEQGRANKLNAIDIVTTANSQGDIYAALSTLPGAQTQDETGQILVRGGNSYESKTYFDGVLVSSPYTSTMPDIPARGRFSPFIFNGITFSSGGYSEEYGQALSSVLALTTNALVEKNITSISILNVGTGASHSQRFNNSSVTLDGNYKNLAPYFITAKHTIDWEKVPDVFDFSGRYRLKTAKDGMLKAYASYSNSHSAINGYKGSDALSHIDLKNKSYFAKASYNFKPAEKWLVNSGIGINNDYDITILDSAVLNKTLNTKHATLKTKYKAFQKVHLRFGAEWYRNNYVFDYRQNNYDTGGFYATSNYQIFSQFAGADIQINKKLATRIGVRNETRGRKYHISPRFALAYTINEHHQLSMALGLYHQTPQNRYLIYNSGLTDEKCNHFLVNYQWEKDKQLFRAEVYVKDYQKLIVYEPGVYGNLINLGNQGKGYARGFDIFWRDKKNIKYLDYWASYSYIDTQRKYHNYPDWASPNYISKHSFSVVGKYWINKITTQLGASYSYKSGRLYHHPNDTEFMHRQAPDLHNISLNASYITNIFGYFTIVHFSANNLLAQGNVFGYKFTEETKGSGIYKSHPITPSIQQAFIIAVFITFD